MWGEVDASDGIIVVRRKGESAEMDFRELKCKRLNGGERGVNRRASKG